LTETVSKKKFGELIGVGPSRVSQMLEEGLPQESDGRISIAKGTAWVKNNLDGFRRLAKAGLGDTAGTASQLRAAKMYREARLLDLELKQREGDLVPRSKVEDILFGRARFERDAWIGWSQRAATELASVVAADPNTIFSVIDRLVREHLQDLSSTSSIATGDK
jgi:hypothetical protein